MTQDKLVEIIAQKNDDMERAVTAKARQLIDQIAQQRQRIDEANQEILELRNELRSLQIKTVDAASILGE